MPYRQIVKEVLMQKRAEIDRRLKDQWRSHIEIKAKNLNGPTQPQDRNSVCGMFVNPIARAEGISMLKVVPLAEFRYDANISIQFLHGFLH